MPCPLNYFASAPHILEKIFTSSTLTYRDFQRCKLVNSQWRIELLDMERRLRSLEENEEHFNRIWLSNRQLPTALEFGVRMRVKDVTLVSNCRWLFLQGSTTQRESDPLLLVAFDLSEPGRIFPVEAQTSFSYSHAHIRGNDNYMSSSSFSLAES